jgi:hypothetical protein
MREHLCCIHGLGLRLSTNDPAIASAGQLLLRQFPREGAGDPVALEIRLDGVQDRSAIPIAVSPSARHLYSQTGRAVGDRLRTEWGCDLYRDEGRLIADFHEQGLLRIDDERGRAEGYLVQPDAMHQQLHVDFIQFALAELLKRQGVYSIHAAALEKDGYGVLIPAFQGRGKSTCCISLLRSGYRCLSDDHPLLRENGAGLELLSFPVTINVTEQCIQFFPELRDARERLSEGLRKRQFRIDELYPRSMAVSGRPALILFPQIIEWPTSRLELLPKSRALEELLRHGLKVFDREVARRQFQTYSRLVESTPCYRLYFGEDVLDLPRLIDPLLAEAGAAPRHS